jgi:hypothetical protein
MRFRSVKKTENLYYSSPDGLIKLCFCIEDDTIIQVRFTDGIESNVPEGELYSAIKTQFDDYFAGNLQSLICLFLPQELCFSFWYGKP